ASQTLSRNATGFRYPPPRLKLFLSLALSCDFEYNSFGTSSSLWLFSSLLRCNPSLLRGSFYFNSQFLRITGMLQNTEMRSTYSVPCCAGHSVLRIQCIWRGNVQESLQKLLLCEASHFGPDIDRCPSPSALACRWAFHIAVRRVLPWLAGRDEHMLLKCSFRRHIQVLAVVPTEQHN